MSLESAQQFVSRMREDKEFRATVGQTDDTRALNAYLKRHGFDFDQRELVEAMATCMAELEAMEQASE